jgi:NAD(P)-dependent dehydrogenase (short-subunit alcohol dehydrogenase family)
MPRVLITGCSTGIGRATASLLTARGYEVVATARQLSGLDGLDVASKLQLDVTDDQSVAAAVDAAGDVDVLVNNAGYSVWAPIETVPLAELQRLVDTNVFGVVRMIQAILPGMRARKQGKIVNISSAAGRTGGSPILGWYALTKNAVEVISEALRYEVGHLGIEVIIVEPGAIATKFPENRVLVGLDKPPYDALGTRFFDYIASTRSTTYPPEHVAGVIAEALEAERPRLRWFGSPDAERIVASRHGVSDEQIEAGMRARFGFDA